MSNATGVPRSGQTRPSAPGSANGVDDATVIRPAVAVTDDGPPTLAERIMASRTPPTNEADGSRSTGAHAAPSGPSHSNGNGTNGSVAPRSPATPALRPQTEPGAPDRPGAQSAPSAGAPNAGQPFRNGQPRPARALPARAQPATYSPVPNVPAVAQPSGQRAAVRPGAAADEDNSDPFSVWRKKPYPEVPDGAPGSAASAGAVTPTASAGSASRAASAPRGRAARAAKPTARETLATGAGAAAVTTGLAARAVPSPAPSAPGASAPTSSSSAGAAGAAAKSDKLVVRRTRKARLRLSRVDPWSVMKTAFMFSIAAGIVLVVAVYGLWSVIQASDMFTAVNQIVQDAVGTTDDTTPFQLEQYINTPKVMGATSLIAAVDVVLVTALATLVAFLYNLSASVLGGLEVTLAED